MSLQTDDFSKEDLLRSGFSYRTAKTLAAASSIAYQDEAFVRANLEQLGVPLVEFIESAETDTQGFVAANDQALLVSFRGTENLRDWIQNIKIGQRGHPIGGEVHIGFDKALDSVWEAQLLGVLGDPAHAGKRLLLTGHSLGGALATLCGARIAAELDPSQITAFYTFGQPLVGDARFVAPFNALFSNRFFRFRYHRDIVTRIPPKPIYRHTFDRIKLNKDGNVVDGPGFGGGWESFVAVDPSPAPLEEDEDVLSRVEFLALQKNLGEEESKAESLFGLSGIKDHSLSDSYLPVLRKHASEEASSAPGESPVAIGLATVTSPGAPVGLGGAESVLPAGELLSDAQIGDEISLDDPSTMTAAERMERVIDQNNLLPVSFFEMGALRQRSVLRVVLTRPYKGFPPGTGFGTGFLIAPDIVMTNNHVVPGSSVLSSFRFEFNFQLGIDGMSQPTTSFLPRPDGFIHTNKSLDYTLIRLAPRSDDPGGHAGDDWGFVPLQPFVHFRAEQHFNVIQHPGGRHKQISVQDNKIHSLFTNVVRYESDTEPGSSGSPVFDNLWQLVALHHAGGARDANGKWLNNEGIRIDRIVADLREHFIDSPNLLAEIGIA